MCYRICFSDASRNGREHTYIMYFARACARAHTYTRKRRTCTRKGTCSCTHEETGWTTVMQREKPVETQKNLSILGLYFFKGRRKNWKEFVSAPQKNPWSSGSVSRKQSFLCQPENRNFPETANFMSSKGQEFPGYDHFHANRKTKKNKSDNLFLRPAGKSRPEFLSRKAENPKKISWKTGNGATAPKPVFSMWQGKWHYGNLPPQGHFCTGRPAFFMFPYQVILTEVFIPPKKSEKTSDKTENKDSKACPKTVIFPCSTTWITPTI